MYDVYIVSQLHINKYCSDIKTRSDVFESKKEAKEFAMNEFVKIKKSHANKYDVVYVNTSKTLFKIKNNFDYKFHHICVKRKRIITKSIKSLLTSKRKYGIICSI